MVDVATRSRNAPCRTRPGHHGSRRLDLIRSHGIAKGNVLTVAQIAGSRPPSAIGELIPLCHPLNLDHVDVTLDVGDGNVTATSQVFCTGRTGVEMEALTAVSVAR